MSTSLNAELDLAIIILSVVLLTLRMFAHGEGRITPEQYDKTATANKARIAQLQQQLSQSKDDSKDLVITAEYLLNLL